MELIVAKHRGADRLWRFGLRDADDAASRRRRCAGSRKCGPTSSPMPATSCASPLAALSGFIDTLQGPARDDAKARERFLGIMHAQATRMARLIDDLLSLSRDRIERACAAGRRWWISSIIIRQVVDGLEALAHERAGDDRGRAAGDAGHDRRGIAKSCCACSRT